jgi:hypothetical protein
MKAHRKRTSGLSAAARSLLRRLLELELDGTPIEMHSWRAKNAKKIPLLEELGRHRMWEGSPHAHITFWGLLNARGPRAESALHHTERVFRVLARFYPDHPTGSLPLNDLAKRARLTEQEALRAAHFLARSPVHLSIGTHEPTPLITPNEQYVTLKGIDDLKRMTRQFFENPIRPIALPGTTDPAIERQLLSALNTAESEAVREAWTKVQQRLQEDPEGAITTARSLLEAGCKFVLEDRGDTAEEVSDLPRLYRRAAEHLKLDARGEINESLRRVLAACAAIVDGVAHLRNRLSDAHGKNRRSAKPGRRHAEFIVLIAAAMTALMLSSLDAQRTL